MKGLKMSKNINFKKQDEWVAAKVSQPFTFEYEGETIEVNPVFSPEQCMRMGDEITAIVVGADRYYPELRTFAQRLSVVNAIVTNITPVTAKVINTGLFFEILRNLIRLADSSPFLYI